LKPVESVPSRSGTGARGRTKCACIGRHAPRCSASAITGTCCRRRRRHERRYGTRSIRTPAGAGSSGINNAIRGLASIVKRSLGSQGSAIASATTTAIGAAGTALYATVTGTTTITSFGTVGAGTFRIIEFSGALTLTHNATSLKLPGSANITTAAGDVGFFLSLGSGNWKCLHFSKADGSAVASFNGTLTSTDPGAAQGPVLELFRNSASPASGDALGEIEFTGKDSGAGIDTYARIIAAISDPTAGSEDGQLYLRTAIAGTLTTVLLLGAGAQIGAPSGGDKGAGTLNLDGACYIDGNPVCGPIYIIADQKTSGTAGGQATSGSFEKCTLNTEIIDQIGIATTASVLALSAGTYRARWSVPRFNCNFFITRLRNTTNSVTLGTGTSEWNNSTGAYAQTRSHGEAFFTLAGAANVELQCQVSTTNATDGNGRATSLGTETYAVLYLEKVA